MPLYLQIKRYLCQKHVMKYGTGWLNLQIRKITAKKAAEN